MNPPNQFGDQEQTMRRLGIVLCAVAVAWGDLSWDFSTPDPRPTALDGIFGYVYPSPSSVGQTVKHTASLHRKLNKGTGSAVLKFDLDGLKYPSAGFGLMFEDAAPIDLRSLTTISLRVRADRSRRVRLSLSPQDSTLKLAADTGVSFGRDTLVDTGWVSWTIQSSDLSWPRWATIVPAAQPAEILARIFALQFDVGCETKSGACSTDSGWIEVDDIQMKGVGGLWVPPSMGDCSGSSLPIDQFASSPDRQNDLGGWWYAYTDKSSQDTLARGYSFVKNATNPDSAETWIGPDPAKHQAELQFALMRLRAYSGYAAIETQLTQPVNSVPQAKSFPGMSAISFRVGFDKDFPDALGGVLVHLRKQGQAFENGRDHQIRIPRDSVDRTWCVDLSAFAQPSWSTAWIVPFNTDSLLALSFEVRLPASLNHATSGFHVSDIAFHGATISAIGPRSHRGSDILRPTSTGWTLLRSDASASPTPWQVLSPSGAVLASGNMAANATRLDVPATARGLSLLRLMDRDHPVTIRLLRP